MCHYFPRKRAELPRKPRGGYDADTMKPSTLFRALARRHGEWLAQGLFTHAVRTDAGCRLAVAAAVGLDVDPDEVPAVEEEEPDPQTGWRVDVRLAWETTGRTIRAELKLAATLTRRQRGAVAEERVDLFVIPRSREREPHLGKVPTITWARLSNAASDSTLKRLLLEAEEDVSWFRDEVSGSDLLADFAAFSSGTRGAQWTEMYCFLSTIDVLLQSAMLTYAASTSWSMKKGRWYGFQFTTGAEPLSSSAFWVGLASESDAVPPALILYGHGKRLGDPFPLTGLFRAREIVDEIVKRSLGGGVLRAQRGMES